MQPTFSTQERKNKTDLDKIEAFLDDTFSEFTNRYGDSVEQNFPLVGCIQKKKSKKIQEEARHLFADIP